VRPHVGVCSWSLRPASPKELADLTAAAGLHAVQIALDPVRTAWGLEPTLAALRAARIRLLSGMMAMQGEDYSSIDSIRRTGGIRPDSTWQANLDAARENSALARRLGLRLVTFHAGFIPHDPADPLRPRMVERLRTLRDTFAAQGVSIALETGQETPDTLLEVLAQLPGVGINFDPANIILYGMGGPIHALRTLATRIAQIHIKDAIPADRPGQWGAETPVGRGSIDWPRFFAAARELRLAANLVIERESGEARVQDVAAAHQYILPLLAPLTT
jgi:L-ribulose-5-phosphate 3-epimerase